VTDFVLSRPSREEEERIRDAIEQVMGELPALLGGEWGRCMSRLNARRPGA
jgi:peptidyl-tRNA hydrolase